VSAHATTVELPVQVPPLVDEIRDIVLRHLDALDKFPWTYDAAEAAAFRILAITEVAAGLRDTRLLGELGPRLAALDALHQPHRWSAESTVIVCSHCHTGWKCRDRQILDGEVTS